MLTFPTISVNSDSIAKYRATYATSTSADIVLPYDGNRKIILSAITKGATLDIGLTETKQNNMGTGNDVTKTFNAAATFPPNIGATNKTVKIYVDNVLVGSDALVSGTIAPVVAGFLTGTVVYAVSIQVVFTTAPLTGVIIMAKWEELEASTSPSRITFVGTAPLDASAFLKNAPYSFFKQDKAVIIRCTGSGATIAYTEVKG